MKSIFRLSKCNTHPKQTFLEKTVFSLSDEIQDSQFSHTCQKREACAPPELGLHILTCGAFTHPYPTKLT